MRYAMVMCGAMTVMVADEKGETEGEMILGQEEEGKKRGGNNGFVIYFIGGANQRGIYVPSRSSAPPLPSLSATGNWERRGREN